MTVTVEANRFQCMSLFPLWLSSYLIGKLFLRELKIMNCESKLLSSSKSRCLLMNTCDFCFPYTEGLEVGE